MQKYILLEDVSIQNPSGDRPDDIYTQISLSLLNSLANAAIKIRAFNSHSSFLHLRISTSPNIHPFAV